MFRSISAKRVLVSLICVIVLIAAWLIRLEDPGPVNAIRYLTFDTYQRIKPRPATDFAIRIVDIDQPSLRAIGQWPWPRDQVAQMVTKLGEAGAAVIAFDVVFSEPDRTSPGEIAKRLSGTSVEVEQTKKVLLGLPDNDDILENALSEVNSVLAFFAKGSTPISRFPPKANIVIAGDDPTPALPALVSIDSSLDNLINASVGHGIASIFVDERSDVIRKYQLFYADPTGTPTQNLYPALGLEALRVALEQSNYLLKNTGGGGEIATNQLAMTGARVGDFEIPLTADGSVQLYFSPNRQDRYLPAKSVFEKSAEDLRPLIEGHIVFIGASAAGLRDLRTNALGETVPGVSVHAELVDQILAQTFLSRPDWAGGLEIWVMIITGLLIIVLLPYLSALASALFGLLCALIVLVGSWRAFVVHGVLLDPVYPIVVGTILYTLSTILLFSFAEREKRFVRTAFQRYLAPDLLAKLEDRPDSLKLGGEMREMTLMFMDIRGFTPISEKLPPERLVAFLNTLLSPLSDIIKEHEGAIDKYIGDSIMAFWNAPLDVEDHPQKALRAGLAMLKEVDRLNAADAFGFKQGNTGLGDVEIGIGINTGDGCVGNMGSASRFDYSVIGDTVNVASRIESSCKAVGWPLLISRETAARCKGFAMLEAGSIALKGKTHRQVLVAVIGDEETAASKEFQSTKNAHTALMEAINTQKAASTIQKLRKNYVQIAPPNLHDFIVKLGASIEPKTPKKGSAN